MGHKIVNKNIINIKIDTKKKKSKSKSSKKNKQYINAPYDNFAPNHSLQNYHVNKPLNYDLSTNVATEKNNLLGNMIMDKQKENNLLTLFQQQTPPSTNLTPTREEIPVKQFTQPISNLYDDFDNRSEVSIDEINPMHKDTLLKTRRGRPLNVDLSDDKLYKNLTRNKKQNDAYHNKKNQVEIKPYETRSLKKKTDEEEKQKLAAFVKESKKPMSEKQKLKKGKRFMNDITNTTPWK